MGSGIPLMLCSSRGETRTLHSNNEQPPQWVNMPDQVLSRTRLCACDREGQRMKSGTNEGWIDPVARRGFLFEQIGKKSRVFTPGPMRS